MCGLLFGGFLNFNLNFNISNTGRLYPYFNKITQINLPEVSNGYSSSYNNTGDSINVTLHQSNLETGTPLFEIVNASDSTNNTFSTSTPSVTDNKFNSTTSQIFVENITAPDKTLELENDTDNHNDLSTARYFSFNIPINCTLDSIKLYLNNTSSLTSSAVAIYLYGSTSGLPDNFIKQLGTSKTISASAEGYFTFNNLNTKLNDNDTENNKFYIKVDDVDKDSTRIFGKDDGNGEPDDSDVYYWLTDHYQKISIDYFANISLKITSDPIKPSDVGLKVNNTLFDDVDYGSGKKTISKDFSVLPSQIDYIITTDWWDVSVNITKIIVNYTRTDLKATSSYNIASSNQTIQWNGTLDPFNGFDGNFDNYWINFTIPKSWENSTAYNASNTIPSENTTLGPLLNGYREFQIYPASNGDNWHITAESANLLNNIKIFLAGDNNTIYNVNYTDTIDINATFSDTIWNGNITLNIYSPSYAGNYLNHTYSLNTTSLSQNTEFYLENWTIKDDATDYGIFKAQVDWNNGTAAGFLEKDLTINAVTDLIVKGPQKTEFNAGDFFDIQVLYNDTEQDIDINDANISYKINTGSFRPIDQNVDKLGNSLYNITIDCNDTDLIYGKNTITINASKQYYNEATTSFDFTVLAETSLNITYPPLDSFYNSSESFEIRVFFNDTIKDQGIDNAIINYSLDGGNTYRGDKVENFNDGYYNISIACNDTQFNDYGEIPIIVNASKAYHHNQSEQVNISLKGETSLKIISPSDLDPFNSGDTFNITVQFNDTSRNQGISGASFTIKVNGTDYTEVSSHDWNNGTYDITLNASDDEFFPYGIVNIELNFSKDIYYSSSDSVQIQIFGVSNFDRLDPETNAIFLSGEFFNIILRYNDSVRNIGIEDADIEYSLNGTGYKSVKWADEGSGIYNITIDVSDDDFDSFGYRDIIINISKSFYINQSLTYTFHRQILTSIEPSNFQDLGSVLRGLNVSYTFNYRDNDTVLIPGANYSIIGDDYNFEDYLHDYGNGTYTMNLDTDNVVAGYTYEFKFNISAVGNETQIITLNITVTITETDIENLSIFNETIARKSGLNQTINFYFNDTTNNLPITGLTTADVNVYDNSTGLLWDTSDFNWNLIEIAGAGNYSLNVSLNTLDSGWYTLRIEVSKFPNYETSIVYVTFYLRGNYTQFNLNTIESPFGIDIGPIDENYSSYIGNDMYIEFNIIDTEKNSENVTQSASYYVRYININTGENGSISYSLSFDPVDQHYEGTIYLSDIINTGNYQINITYETTNYENCTYSFNLTIIDRFDVTLAIMNKPSEVSAGEPFELTFNVTYYNGTSILIQNANIKITTYVNGQFFSNFTGSTNASGIAVIQITIPGSAKNMNLTVQLTGGYYYKDALLVIDDIEVIPAISPLFPPGEEGFTFEDILPYLIIAIVGAVAIVSAVTIHKKVVVPKKERKQKILKEVKTIFDDAINLEHLLVLYKGMGACIFFKSFAAEKIDPDLISGFISAVSSFGKEIESQRALNEMKYGDKTLLLSDGEYIRVALVLDKKASLPLRRNLREFVKEFEEKFGDKCKEWKGKIDVFQGADPLVDKHFNTSIILPHRINYKPAIIKSLKSPYSKEILKITEELLKETGRDFFFISKLLDKAKQKTSKGIAEIFIGIKELREKELLTPIDISKIEEKPISAEERRQIEQKVEQLLDVSQTQKQEIIEQLSKASPAEREAYLASLEKQEEIVSVPVKSKIGEKVIENKKEAKKELKKLMKKADKEKSVQKYQNAINIYEQAAIIANNWDMKNLFAELQEEIRLTQIHELELDMKEQLHKAERFEKKEDYRNAAEHYDKASKIASQIFKLGENKMQDLVKKYTRKAKKYQKMS
jgi:hypothetical protein